MSSVPPDADPPQPVRSEPDPAEIRRSKLIGRLIIIAFGILLLAYFIPLALNFVK